MSEILRDDLREAARQLSERGGVTIYLPDGKTFDVRVSMIRDLQTLDPIYDVATVPLADLRYLIEMTGVIYR